MTNLPVISQHIPIVDKHGRASFEMRNFWNAFLQYLEKNIEDTVDAALTAAWSQVTDDDGNKPDNNATVGAIAGTNLKDSLSNVLNDADVKNSAITLSSSGTLSGAGGGAVTFDSIGGATTYAKIPAANTSGTGTARRALIDFSSASHANKSLANVDSSANTKLSGIETGATVGANWSTNLTNRPTELTDGRVSTALSSAGRLNETGVLNTAALVGIRNTNSVSLTASDAGASATISVSAHSRKYGDTSSQITVSYNSGSITGLSFSTTYFVYTDDINLAGGAVTYVASTNSDDPAARAGRVYVGKVTTPADGGSGTSGDTGGGSGGGGGSQIP